MYNMVIFNPLQDYEVVVLVGAGIGVTPFASVLADMVNKLESGNTCEECGHVTHTMGHGAGVAVEKIYFREPPFSRVGSDVDAGISAVALGADVAVGNRRCSLVSGRFIRCPNRYIRMEASLHVFMVRGRGSPACHAAKSNSSPQSPTSQLAGSPCADLLVSNCSLDLTPVWVWHCRLCSNPLF